MPAPAAAPRYTAGAAFRRFADFPWLDFGDAFAGGALAILAPHPDDESLGCGGLIAEACARGVPPVVMVLTDGAGSHPNSRLYPPDRLRAAREAETFAAIGKLGLPPERLFFLRLPDRAAPQDGPAAADAVSRIIGIMEDMRCETLLSSWRHDPHCDHEAASALADIACRSRRFRHLAYPVWGLALPPETLLGGTPPAGFRLDIRRHLAAKRAAIFAHRTQYAGIVHDDPAGFQMQPGFIDLFLSGTEIFIECDVAA